MRTALTVTAPPAVEPVSVDLAKAHARIDGVSDDDLVALYLATARQLAEAFLGRALITQTLQWTLRPDPPPYGGGGIVAGSWLSGGTVWGSTLSRPLELPRSPVQSVSSVVVTDANGANTTIDPTIYTLDLALQPSRLWLNLGQLPSTVSIVYPVQHVQVTFVAGYGADGTFVPKTIINAILLMTAWLYEQRGDAGGDMPKAAEALLWPHRIVNFGA